MRAKCGPFLLCFLIILECIMLFYNPKLSGGTIERQTSLFTEFLQVFVKILTYITENNGYAQD